MPLESDEYTLKLRLHSSSDWMSKVISLGHEGKVLVADTHEIAAYNEKHPDRPLKILDERIIKFNEFIGMDLEYLIPIYIKSAGRLRENGLLDRAIEKWFDAKQVRPPPLESEPQVLTFDHVGVAFKISAGFLILALVMFLLEVCYAKMKKSLLGKLVDRFL